MVFLIIILLFLIIYNSKFNIKGFFNDYLQRDKTLAIKGIFVILVFYRHCSSYIYLNSIIDKPMIILNAILLQCIVAMFLFYSGYGIYEQIKQKKDTYIKDFPKKEY